MDIFEGRITSCGFDSGDRIVIGMWESSPFGSFADIMCGQNLTVQKFLLHRIMKSGITLIPSMTLMRLE